MRAGPHCTKTTHVVVAAQCVSAWASFCWGLCVFVSVCVSEAQLFASSLIFISECKCHFCACWIFNFFSRARVQTWRTRPPTCGWSCRLPALSWRSYSSSSSAHWSSTTKRRMLASGTTPPTKTMRMTSTSDTQVSESRVRAQRSSCSPWGFLVFELLPLSFTVRETQQIIYKCTLNVSFAISFNDTFSLKNC